MNIEPVLLKLDSSPGELDEKVVKAPHLQLISTYDPRFCNA